MALFTLGELASYLQTDLDTATATLAQSMATGIVEGYLRRPVLSATYTDASLMIDPRGGTLRVWLPVRPVTDVASVKVSGVTLTEGTDWAWDAPTPVVRLAGITWAADSFPAEPVAVVTYTAGYAAAPADIKAVALSVAGRAYGKSAGIRSESIDDYSVTYAGSDGDLAGIGLIPTEVGVLRRYRSGAGTAAVA